MSETAPAGNGVSYTTKELLSNITGKLDRIEIKLDTKADRAAVNASEMRITEAVHNSEQRLAVLEAVAVRREGPIMDELRAHQKAVDDLRIDVAKLQSGVSLEIQKAVQDNTRLLQDQEERSFTHREKYVLGAFALVGAIGTIVSLVILVAAQIH